MQRRPHVVIVGGGFGGLNAARELRRAPVDITLIDRRNFHLFQPLLYQVATGGLSPGNIAAPLRAILKRQRNCKVWLGEVVGIDPGEQRVLLVDGEVKYDYLIMAAGSITSYFGRADWEKVAPGLKSIEDGLEIRRRVLSAFEHAERETDPAQHAAWLTFVIVGGGPTGVELAGTLAEIAAHTLREEFHNARPAEARIFLVDLAPRVLGAFPENLSEAAAAQLRKKGVTLLTGHKVSSLESGQIVLESEGQQHVIQAETILWAAGVHASPLGKVVAAATNAEVDRSGRVMVRHDMSVPGYENIFVVGDLAHFPGPDGKPLPGVAPVAMQAGKHVARVIRDRELQRVTPAFQYTDYGSMATIGRKAAVAKLGSWEFRGLIAWLLWLFVHLMQIVQFENRVLILFQWAWNYITFSRSARLITQVAPHESRVQYERATPPAA